MLKNTTAKPRFERSFGPPTFTKEKRLYPYSGKTEQQLEIEPNTFQMCPYWNWFVNDHTQQRHKRACGRCRQCRNFKHERIVGQAIAQAQTSGVVMTFTLTYADIEGVTPDAAKRLDYSDIEKFLKRLRKAGYRFQKICCGEYGKEGRAHWHLVLFFEWDCVTKEKALEAIKNGLPIGNVGKNTDWRQLAPPYVANLRGKEFTHAINNPEILVVSYPQKGKTPKIRNPEWKFWPHGIVEAQIAKSPEFYEPEHVEGSIRYPLKYVSKDAWKDSKKFQRIPFDELPEHIKQQTRFGPWYTPEEVLENWNNDVRSGLVKPLYEGHAATAQEHRKWKLGNEYVKELEADLLSEFSSADEIPIERQLYKGQYHYKAKGGLGADYFRAMGAYVARHGTTDDNVRKYQLGANWKAKQSSLGANEELSDSGSMRHVRDKNGKIIAIPKKRFKYGMGNTSLRQFFEGYNVEAEKLRKPQTIGPDDIVETLETTTKKASDASSGAFGYHWWKKASVNTRASIEEATALMPDKHLVQLFPTRWRRNMETTSLNINWRKKGLERQLAEIERQEEKQGVSSPETVSALKENVEHVALMLNNPENRWSKEQKTNVWSLVRQYRNEVSRRESLYVVKPIEQNKRIETGEHWETNKERIEYAKSRATRPKTQMGSLPVKRIARLKRYE